MLRYSSWRRCVIARLRPLCEPSGVFGHASLSFVWHCALMKMQIVLNRPSTDRVPLQLRGWRAKVVTGRPSKKKMSTNQFYMTDEDACPETTKCQWSCFCVCARMRELQNVLFCVCVCVRVCVCLHKDIIAAIWISATT